MARFKKKYKVLELKDGMIIANDVIFGNNVALSANVELNKNLISSLQFLGIEEVYIWENETVREMPLYQDPQQKFLVGYQQMTSKVKAILETIHSSNGTIGGLTEFCQTEILPFIHISGAMNHLQMTKDQGDYAFTHALNVAIVSGLLGKWLRYSSSEINQLILAGLLHDIGKMKISPQITNKKSKLTSEEIYTMKSHVAYGFNLLKEEKNLTKGILLAVLQHHERMDGSGYPNHLVAKKIHPFAKIIAVADVYDARLLNCSYHRKINPFAVLDELYTEMFRCLDPAVCSVFMHYTKDYFNENIVQLNDGRSAEVIRMGSFLTINPLVKTNDGEFIDLDKNKKIRIVKLIKTL